LRQQAAQRQAQIQQQQAQERALNEQRERQRQDYLQRMRMFEALNSINPAAAAAAAGGRSTSVQEFPSVSGQSYIITWADVTDNLWKFVVYNHGTGQLSDTHVTNLVISDWTLNSDSKTVQSKGFTLEFENNNNDTFRIYFVNADGTVVGEKSLDTEEDFQYTERAAGYLGTLAGVSTFYHFDGDNVRTHTFPGISDNNIEIDNASYDDVTADGSMIIEAPDNENYYIARPNGDLVDVSQYFNADTDSFRMDYSTNFIEKASDTYINIVSQEGSLLNTFDLAPFNEASLGFDYTIDESWFYGENCAGAEYNEGSVRLFVSYDGDSNEFVSLTFPNADEIVVRSIRDWDRPVSSFGKSLIISSSVLEETVIEGDVVLLRDDLGYITNITGGFNMWWLPKGATAFNNVDLTSVGTFSFVLGDEDFDSNRSFTLGENPIFMYALENSEIIVGFLEEGGFSTQSTGILSASCSNIWGHNIGEHSFAVFDVDYTSNRIWQMYDSNSKVAETQTTGDWSWGDGDTIQSLRNGTLAVIDSGDTSNSFIYTTEIGLTAGPTGLGKVYNRIPYGINGGIAYEYQVITQYIPGEEDNQYVDGFYVLSKSGLSEYVEFFVGGASPSATYLVNDDEGGDKYCIGSEMISFRLQDSDTGYHRYQVYNRSTLELIHDYQYNNSDTNYYPFDNRFYVEDDDNAGNVEIRLVSLSGFEVLNLQTNTFVDEFGMTQSNFNREANDAEDND
jgi:hypothetical protein